MCVRLTVLLEARYSSNPPGDSVLKSRTIDVDVARKDFWTNENPDPSKWKDVSSAWGLRGRQRDRQTDRETGRGTDESLLRRSCPEVPSDGLRHMEPP